MMEESVIFDVAATDSISPERLFNEFFRSDQISAKDKLRYCGQDELWGLEEQNRSQLDAIRQQINESWATQQGHLRRRGMAPTLHFNYIDTRKCGAGDILDRHIPDAIAFEYKNCSFVGMTRDLIDDCTVNALRLGKTQRIADGFGLRPDQLSERIALMNSFFHAQVHFIANHEVGHHFHGHVLRDHTEEVYSEYGSDGELTVEGSLISQRREIDADGYATWRCLDNFLTLADSRAAFLKGIRKPFYHPRAERWLLRLIVLSAAAFFFSRVGRGGPLNRRSHPPALVRMHYVMNQIHSWARHHNRPNLAKWASVSRFQKLMAAVEQAIGIDHQFIDWHQQSAFFISEAGAHYRSVLEEVEDQVRDRYRDHTWQKEQRPIG